MDRADQFGLTLSSEEHDPAGSSTSLSWPRSADSTSSRSPITSIRGWTSRGTRRSCGRCSARSPSGPTSLDVVVGVTCPIMRIHPAVLAQATATTSRLLGDRFTWGVGTGEALNEHILGDKWPTAPERMAMLEEAIEVIRQLWNGDEMSYRGRVLLRRERPHLRRPARRHPRRRVCVRTEGRRIGRTHRRRIVDDRRSFGHDRPLAGRGRYRARVLTDRRVLGRRSRAALDTVEHVWRRPGSRAS